MSSPGRAAGSRPWEVTVSGLLAVIGSTMVVFTVLTLAEQLDSATMRDTLTQLTTDPRFASLNLTLDDARSLIRYMLMAMGVLSVTSLVLGVYVLRRHQPSRIALTFLGGMVAVVSVFAGLPGWVLTVYVGVSIGLLWTRTARAWFSPQTAGAGGAPSSGGPAPPPPPPTPGWPGT